MVGRGIQREKKVTKELRKWRRINGEKERYRERDINREI